MSCTTIELAQFSPGTRRDLTICRFGRPGKGPKAYVQASMHADELPATLAAQHLRALLQQAGEEDRIMGEIILVPAANPIGFSQLLLDHHMGRHHCPSGRNFNRFWPDATAAVMAQEAQFTPDPAVNLARARRIIRGFLDEQAPHAEDEALKLELMKLAHDADIVLDMHTDLDAELHLYIDPGHWPGLRDLAALLRAGVVMFARHSGGNPFEETVAAPFLAMREADIPCTLPITVTIELRGQLDVDDELARADARAIFDFLILRGLVQGEAEAGDFTGIAAPFEATGLVRAPTGGIIIYECPLGAMVRKGEPIAHIADPLTARRTPVKANQTGRLFTRNLHRLAHAGDVIAKIQGTSPLPERKQGALMTD